MAQTLLACGCCFAHTHTHTIILASCGTAVSAHSQLSIVGSFVALLHSAITNFNCATIMFTPQVGRKIALQKDRQAMVLCVVDVWDFDGSLPRTALA